NDCSRARLFPLKENPWGHVPPGPEENGAWLLQENRRGRSGEESTFLISRLERGGRLGKRGGACYSRNNHPKLFNLFCLSNEAKADARRNESGSNGRNW